MEPSHSIPTTIPFHYERLMNYRKIKKIIIYCLFYMVLFLILYSLYYIY